MNSLDLLQLEQSRWHLGMIAMFAPLSHPCSTRTPVPPNAQIDSPPLNFFFLFFFSQTIAELLEWHY
jgi:hypothetical protein